MDASASGYLSLGPHRRTGLRRLLTPGLNSHWSMDDRVCNVIAVADAVGAKQFHIVGESLGCTVTFAIAIARPERLLSIVPICAGLEGAYGQEVDRWRVELDAFGTRAWSSQMMDHRFNPGASTDAQWVYFENIQVATAPVVNIGLMEMLISFKVTNALADIGMPTLILHPAPNPFLPVHVPRSAHKLISQSELHIFESARHVIAFSHARESASLLKDFIDRRCR